MSDEDQQFELDDSKPDPCQLCGGRGHVMGEECDWCDGTGEA